MITFLSIQWFAAKLKGPRNPYIIFSADVKERVKQELLENPIPEGSRYLKRVAELWRTLPANEKRRYEEMAKQEQAAFKYAQRKAEQDSVGK